MHQNPKTHQSLERALEVLLYFRNHNSEIGILDISQKLGLHKSTASRIMTVLRSHGFLQQSPDNKKYSLGPAIADLGSSLRRSLRSNLTQIAKPFLDELRNLCGETIVLEIPTLDRTVLTYVAEGLGPVRIRGAVGDRHHYHTSAGAKAILAFSDRSFKETVLSRMLPAITQNSKTNRFELAQELDSILESGYAFDREENNIGIQAFGAPIFSHEGIPVAAVVIAGAKQNVTLEKKDYFVQLIKDTASQISEQLFFKSSTGASTEFNVAPEGLEIQ